MSRGDAFSCSWTLRIPFSFSFTAGVIEVDSLVCTCHLPFWPLCHFSPLKPSTGFTLLTILHPTDFYDFSAGLSEHRSPEEKAGIVDEFFKRYENLVAKNPADHGVDYVHAFMVIAKSWQFIWYVFYQLCLDISTRFQCSKINNIFLGDILLRAVRIDIAVLAWETTDLTRFTWLALIPRKCLTSLL